MTSKNNIALKIDHKIKKLVEYLFKQESKGDEQARIKAKSILEKYLIKTDDGSYTVKSDIINGESENMHTIHGAVSESLKKFVKPAQLEGKTNIQVLDICSGLGYNAASCLEFVDEQVEVHLDMVEISPETLALSLLIDAPLKSYIFIQQAVEEKLYQEGYLSYQELDGKAPERINIQIYIEDARSVMRSLQQNKYDAIFLDPFSPLKSPELYTEDFLTCLKDLLKEDGLILTYTAAAPVRAAMINIGLHVGEGPSFARSGGTIAALDPDIPLKHLSLKDERMIALSDAGITFKDPDLNLSSQTILNNRTQERKKVRGIKKFPSTVKTPVYLCRDIDDPRLKRRVINNLKKLGLNDTNSFKSKYLVCPQFDICICGCGCENYTNSQERINEMMDRLQLIINNSLKN